MARTNRAGRTILSKREREAVDARDRERSALCVRARKAESPHGVIASLPSSGSTSRGRSETPYLRARRLREEDKARHLAFAMDIPSLKRFDMCPPSPWAHMKHHKS